MPENISSSDEQKTSSKSLIELQIALKKESAETLVKAAYVQKQTTDRKYQQELMAEETTLALQSLAIKSQDQYEVQRMILSADERRKTLLEKNIFSHLTNGVLKLAQGETALIVSTSGNGKTTKAVTLAATGIELSQKVIYLNNEMLAEDIYFKIAAAYAGIEFHGVGRLDEDKFTLLSNIVKSELCHNIVVVDDSYNGFKSGVTTTLEGMRWCLKNLVESEEKFDLGIIDYYQQIDTAIASPGLESWKVQELFLSELSRFRAKSQIPLIIFAQVKNQDSKYSIKDRIEGRKSIVNKADIILELYSDHKTGTARLIVEKCRSNGGLKGTSFPLIYKDGRFHPTSKGGK